MRVITDEESWSTAESLMGARRIRAVRMDTVGQFMAEVTRYFPEFEGFESMYSFHMEPSLTPIAVQGFLPGRYRLDPNVLLARRMEVYAREYFGIDVFDGIDCVSDDDTFGAVAMRRDELLMSRKRAPSAHLLKTRRWSSAVEDDVWEFLSMGAERPEDRGEFLRVLVGLNTLWRSLRISGDELRDDGTPWIAAGMCDRMGNLIWNQQLARMKTGRETKVFEYAYQRGLDSSIEALMDGVPVEYVTAGWIE